LIQNEFFGTTNRSYKNKSVNPKYSGSFATCGLVKCASHTFIANCNIIGYKLLIECVIDTRYRSINRLKRMLYLFENQ